MACALHLGKFFRRNTVKDVCDNCTRQQDHSRAPEQNLLTREQSRDKKSGLSLYTSVFSVRKIRPRKIEKGRSHEAAALIP